MLVTIDQLIEFFKFLAVLVVPVAMLLEQLKPVFLNNILETYGEQVYLLGIYVVRTVAAFLILGISGGVQTVLVAAPFFANFPEVAVWVISIFFVVFGTEVLHPIVDTLYSLRDLLDKFAHPTPAPVPPVVPTPVEPAPAG